MNKLRVLSLFSGAGAFEKALENLGMDHEIVGYCEIDKYAAKAYSVLHGVDESMNYGDITKIVTEELPEFDLVTYGFPCQDISVAGKQAGINEGTRSGLVSYPLKFIAAKKPKYAICENVKNLVGKKFREDFDGILADLESMGYTNHWKVLNSKEHGVPQNRERVYLVSIRNDLDQSFTFPEPYDNGVRLRDILEPVVDEKYYIDDAKCTKLLEELNKGKGMTPVDEPSGLYLHDSMAFSKDALPGLSRCLKANNHDAAVVIPCITPDRLVKRQNGRRFKEDGDPAFTVTSMDRHGVLVRENCDTCRYYDLDEHGDLCGECEVISPNNIDCLGLLEIKGNQQIRRVYGTGDIPPALNTMQGGNRQPKVLVREELDGTEENGVTREILPTVRCENGTQEIQDKDGINDRVYGEKVLRQGVYEGEFQGSQDRINGTCNNIKTLGTQGLCERSLRNVSNNDSQSARCASQGHESIEQRSSECDNIVSELPLETAQTEGQMHNLRRSSEGSWTMRQTPAKNEEIRRSDVYQEKSSVQNMWIASASEGIMWEALPTIKTRWRIRKLTALECFRLQAFNDADHAALVSAGISNSQLYKIMGNSITVSVLEGIFKELLCPSVLPSATR